MAQNIPDILGIAFRIFRIGLSSSVGALTLKFRNSTGDINLIANPTTTGEVNVTLPVSPGTLARLTDIPSASNFVDLSNTQTITGAKTFSTIPSIPATSNKTFGIGLSSSSGASTLIFINTSGSLSLSGNPTANRTITLPDLSGTLALISDTDKRASIQVNASRAIATTDFNRYLEVNSSSQVILTVDASIFTTDAEVEITQLGTGNVLINPSSTTTLLRRFGTVDPGTLTCGINSTTTVTSSALFGSVNVGDLVFGTGIPAGATVTAITSTSSITISAAATVTNASASLTFVRSHQIAGRYAVAMLKQISATEIQLIGSFA
jgi:hypothetical protein